MLNQLYQSLGVILLKLNDHTLLNKLYYVSLCFRSYWALKFGPEIHYFYCYQKNECIFVLVPAFPIMKSWAWHINEVTGNICNMLHYFSVTWNLVLKLFQYILISLSLYQDSKELGFLNWTHVNTEFTHTMYTSVLLDKKFQEKNKYHNFTLNKIKINS